MTGATIMMELTAESIAAWTGGTVTTGAEGAAGGVSTDTRTLGAGDLYVALRGERFDGHSFLEAAFAGGAWGVLVEEGSWATMPALQRQRISRLGAVIPVTDTERALGDLAAGYRRSLDVHVLAVTGSNGKTTTKDMAAAVVGRQKSVYSTKGNLNNHIGLPLSVLEVEEQHEVAVLEMGMNHRGEIARLAEIAAPDVSVITNVGRAHLEHLGSLEAVAEAKAELLAGMKDDGAAVLCGDDAMLPLLRRFLKTKSVTFGFGADVDFRAEDMVFREGETSFRLVTPEGSDTVELSFTGKHNVLNALAAAAAASLLGASLQDVREGLARVSPPAMRFMLQRFRDGITVVNDAYNANPDSMSAALAAFDLLPGRGRRAAVLGDMLELGSHAGAAHRRTGEKAAALGLDLLVAVGNHAGETAAGAKRGGLDSGRIRVAADAEEAAEALAAWLGPGDLVLLKASRGVGLEKTLHALLDAGRLLREGGAG